jgi:hypothetical protein
MKPGDIVENYQGAFAKVVRLTEGGHTHLSAWVRTPELAAQEEVAVSFLNDFGLSQILKDGANVGKTEDFVDVSKPDTEAKAAESAEKPLSKMNAEELKAKATEMGLPAEGTKAELIAAIEAKAAESAE